MFSFTEFIPIVTALVMVGASLTAVMVTVVLPLAVIGPPEPCALVLPSLKLQLICTEAGGAWLVLLYAMALMALLTSVCVALLLKVSSSVPALLLVTVPMIVPETTRLPPWVSAPSRPDAE